MTPDRGRSARDLAIDAAGLVAVVAAVFLSARHLGPAAGAAIAGVGLVAMARIWSGRLDRLRALAGRDDLTGLGNDRRFRASLARATETPKYYQFLVLVDVDEFKSYNDTFGHPAGDAVLTGVGEALAASGFEAFRLGGDEFAMLLPAMGPERALLVAERLRSAIESREWPQRAVTVSIGLASFGPGAVDPAEVRDRADRALYRAKREGRNRVVFDKNM